mgnify:CR=1 FL=1
MTSSKTVNIDNPKLTCRIKGFEKFSPVRIILDKNLSLNKNTYIFKSANKKNTIVFYNKANKSRISMFKKKKIELIKAKLNDSNYLDLKSIMKKLYSLGFRNTLVEGGDLLTTNLLKDKIFNEFYLFKSQKKLPTNSDFVKFNGLNVLNKKYPFRQNLNSSYGKDTITHYNK